MREPPFFGEGIDKAVEALLVVDAVCVTHGASAYCRDQVATSSGSAIRQAPNRPLHVVRGSSRH